LTRLDEFLTSGFNALQKTKAEVLAEAILELDEREGKALRKKMIDTALVQKLPSPTTVLPGLYTSAEIDEAGNIALQTEEFKKESEALLKLMTDEKVLELIGIKAGSLGGAGGAAAPQEAKAEVKEAEPVKEEKKAFDVELTSFAPEAKVKLIKEIKDMLKLGLKEVRFC
jgi:large subunit ribosomal protein L7/L12